MYECESDTRNHASLLTPFTYANSMLIPNVIVLHFIDYYVQCYRYFMTYQLPCLNVACMLCHMSFLSVLGVNVTVIYSMSCVALMLIYIKFEVYIAMWQKDG